MAAQLIRSATSPAASYAEAVAAKSRRDFVHKLRVCLKELREMRAWLQFARRMELSTGDEITRAAGECQQLIAILAASIKTATTRAR